jgi:formate dehydrogenase accessory protein FdhE
VAKALLAFYGKLLRIQREVYEELRRRQGWLPSGRLEQDLPVLRAMVPKLLDVIEECGPAALSGEAQHLRRASEGELDLLLLTYWHEPSDLQFFAKAFLQPYAQWLAEAGVRRERHLGGGENRCPFCGGQPQLTFRQAKEPASDGGGRNMLCATCLTVWPFRRVVCAHCGEERPAKLGFFHSPEYDHVRIEACDTCQHYIKSVDLMRFGLAVPLVDEVAAAPLDLWAGEHGYTKIELNQLGL